MKIVRNGNEFELTKDELYTAYLEQEHEFDRDTCLCYIDEHFSDDEWYGEKSYDDIVQLADKMAYEYRRCVNKYLDEDSALSNAWDCIKGTTQN
jgi:hypothetical protein